MRKRSPISFHQPTYDYRDKEQVRVRINAAMCLAQCSSAHPSYRALLVLKPQILSSSFDLKKKKTTVQLFCQWDHLGAIKECLANVLA